MPKKKKRTGSTGRFGPRYGTRVRARVKSVEDRMQGRHTCPQCQAKKVSRVGTGIWECERCGNKFTAKAYDPETTSIQKKISEESEEVDVSEIAEQEV